MEKAGKKMSNAFSTGGGGLHFEAHVQASFVALMLTEGFAPCLPCWPIDKIKLQGKSDGYDTDDMIVFLKGDKNYQNCKMLAQIKHSVTITENNEIFREVIQSAWNDYNNETLFKKNKDIIALIAGPLSKIDIENVRIVLDWTRKYENSEEFFRKVEMTRFSSAAKVKKLDAFRKQLTNANGGNPVAENELFEFLKHFHLLSYDLDIESGVVLSLFRSLIGHYTQEKTELIWSRLVDIVQSFNKCGGTITQENLPEDICESFQQRIPVSIPKEYLPSNEPDIIDWNLHEYASDLTIANMIGSWDENNESDLEIIKEVVTGDIYEWMDHLREILQLHETPMTLNNGKWSVKDRKVLWQILRTRIFDKDLENFKNVAITILKENDPKFGLPPEQRFAATIYGKALTYSDNIRKGIVGGLALFGTQPEVLTYCSRNRAEYTAFLTVREILDSSDWVLWGTLDTHLPTLAEAAPTEFLDAVENALKSSPCPFDRLFSEEGNSVTGGCYIAGLLWALEALAWDEEYIVRSCALLGNLASRDPGGNYINRPSNSLSEILLPWKPHTIAKFDKRKAVMKILEKEEVSVAWKLALSLLPNQMSTSSGSYRPKWRKIIPDDEDIQISNEEYWEQISFYAERALSMAKDNIGKLSELISYLNNLPEPCFDKLLEYLSSEKITNKPEDERLDIWEKLVDLIQKHKRYPNAKWAFKAEELLKIESLVEKLAPKNPINSYRRIFNHDFFELYEVGEDWNKQQIKLEKRRSEAIREILDSDGFEGVLKFVESIEDPFSVGLSLGSIADISIDNEVIPKYLTTENKKLQRFLSGYIRSRNFYIGREWVDNIDKSSWSLSEKSTFLICLPFNHETWNRVPTLLGELECDYWKKVKVVPEWKDGDIGGAVDELIKYGRPNAAIFCLCMDYSNNKSLDKSSTVNALMSALSSEEPLNTMDYHHVQTLIKVLQEDPNVDHNELFNVEWAYLPILDRLHGMSPKELERRLASNSGFFCDLISRIYLSKNENKSERKRNEKDEIVATNAWKLLDMWQKPPGTQADGSFSGDEFRKWLNETKETCTKSGHLEVALIHVGKVLFYSPCDLKGLWINETVADELNKINNSKMLDGYTTEIFNSRGVHFVDPTGEPERKLAEKYREQADDLENAGYQRFAASLKDVAQRYERDAEENINEYIEEDD